MHNIATLLLTIFLSNGDATARAIITPDMEQCEAARPAIIEMVVKGGVMKVAGETITITYVDGFCHEATEGKRV